ncbi:unnamed protein product [Lactuca saligna]|uniref:Uncharacterized protein n=1 Tax=Lactuca saligna TaxID=75948 RepID=A0AA35ZYD2_LACSI|nr:unnamed protein product [Lactuca saligna]
MFVTRAPARGLIFRSEEDERSGFEGCEEATFQQTDPETDDLYDFVIRRRRRFDKKGGVPENKFGDRQCFLTLLQNKWYDMNAALPPSPPHLTHFINHPKTSQLTIATDHYPVLSLFSRRTANFRFFQKKSDVLVLRITLLK